MPAVGAAFLSDIHGNAPALEAVLADAKRRGAVRFLNLGDIVGEAPFPNQTLDLLRSEGVVSIRGNFDRNITEFESRIAHAEKTKHPARVAAIRFSHSEITPTNLRYLSDLPARREVDLEGSRVLMVHGSPRKDNEFLYVGAPEQLLAELAATTDADVIATGHTHQAYVRRAAGRLWINAGSAGRPVGDRRASYVYAACSPGAINAEVVRVAYPVERVVEEIERLGLPVELRNVFLKGRYLP